MNWHPFEAGRSLGTSGSEGGAIVRDEEHVDGARITLERDGATAPVSITCGIYGWMVHTRFFAEEGGTKRVRQDEGSPARHPGFDPACFLRGGGG